MEHHDTVATDEEKVSFQWNNPDFPLKNLDFLFRILIS